MTFESIYLNKATLSLGHSTVLDKLERMKNITQYTLSIATIPIDKGMARIALLTSTDRSSIY